MLISGFNLNSRYFMKWNYFAADISLVLSTFFFRFSFFFSFFFPLFLDTPVLQSRQHNCHFFSLCTYTCTDRFRFYGTECKNRMSGIKTICVFMFAVVLIVSEQHQVGWGQSFNGPIFNSSGIFVIDALLILFWLQHKSNLLLSPLPELHKHTKNSNCECKWSQIRQTELTE